MLKHRLTGIAVRNVTLPHRYGSSRAIWDLTVLPATWQRRHSCLHTQPKLVLDLATPKRSKAMLTKTLL